MSCELGAWVQGEPWRHSPHGPAESGEEPGKAVHALCQGGALNRVIAGGRQGLFPRLWGTGTGCSDVNLVADWKELFRAKSNSLMGGR